jgi:endonuclease-8
VPEGDTLHRTAAGLRPHLVGKTVTKARAHTPGPAIDRILGATITGVESVGKNLLIRFDNGLELRTHLRLHGSWHRYRPGERWRRPPARARLVLETADAVAVCFDCPTVELFEQRAEHLHPSLSKLGPDLLSPEFDATEAHRRLRDPSRAAMTIAEALLDQRAMAGVGNVYKSEVLWLERVSPFATVASVEDPTLDRLIARSRELLTLNADRRRGAGRITTAGRPEAGGSPLWIYGRRGRPCRRCGTPIRAVEQGSDLPRLTYWCPRCQGEPAATDSA